MYGKCEICEKWANLHRHHVFMGNKQRSISEKYGAVMYLCPECHTDGKAAVHRNKAVRLWTQEEMQKKLMQENSWTVQDFIKIFGRNYL